jgi:hypothetical protein
MKHLRVALCFLLPLIFGAVLRPHSPVEDFHPEESAAAAEEKQFLKIPPAPKFEAPAARALATEISRWIADDELCETDGRFRWRNDVMASDDPKRLTTVYRALAKRNLNPCLAAVLSETKTDALGFASRGEDAACRFVRALVHSGQWFGLQESPVLKESLALGNEKAQALLEELAAEDPDNGIYPFFLLGILGTNESVFQQMLRAKRFENPISALRLELRELGHQNGAAYLFAVEVASAVNAPDYAKAQGAARVLVQANQYPEFRPWVDRFVQRMAETDQKNLTHDTTNILEDSVLRGLVLAGLKGPLPPSLEQKEWVKYFGRRNPFMLESLDANLPCPELQKRLRELLPEALAVERLQIKEWHALNR